MATDPDNWIENYERVEQQLLKLNEQKKRSADKKVERVNGQRAKAMPHARSDGATIMTKDADGAPTAFQMNEHNMALAFAMEHEERLRYSTSAGKWFLWDGTHWRPDDTLRAFDWVRHFTQHLNVEGRTKWASYSVMRAVERISQSDGRLAIGPNQWDSDPNLLATPGGTLDLRTFELRPASPHDLITKCTSVAPEPGRSRLWEDFLRDATQGDAALARFLRQIAGYSLTGATELEVMFYLYGTGGNGKGVYLQALLEILGSYACTTPFDMFLARRYTSHPTELAFLHGRRLVSATETEEGRAWDEQRVKAMIGRDPITARYMRQDFFTFEPVHKLVLTGNHRPVLRGLDDAWKRRILMVPFNHKPEVPDTTLKDRMRAEYPLILTWAMEGLRDLREHGLAVPGSVTGETERYFDAQDLVGDFIAERFDLGRGLYTSNPDLFSAWENFCKASGEFVGTQRMLSDRLESRGFGRVKGGKGAYFRGRGHEGLSLKPAGFVSGPYPADE